MALGRAATLAVDERVLMLRCGAERWRSYRRRSSCVAGERATCCLGSCCMFWGLSQYALSSLAYLGQVRGRRLLQRKPTLCLVQVRSLVRSLISFFHDNCFMIDVGSIGRSVGRSMNRSINRSCPSELTGCTPCAAGGKGLHIWLQSCSLQHATAQSLPGLAA